METFDLDLYRYVYVDGKPVPEHVYLWEQAHGPKPKGCDIHHINGNGKDNRLENLVCLTKSEHKTLHAKLKREGRDVVDSTDPAVIASRARKNAATKAHRLAHLEEERAKDRAEYQRNKGRIKERNHDFYLRNRENLRSQQAEYEREHKAERAARNAAYYAEHSDERKAYIKEYREAHREEIAAKKREYNAAHPEIVQAQRAAYKEVHAAYERFRRAVKQGLPEEVVAQRKAEFEQARLEHKQRKATKGQDNK